MISLDFEWQTNEFMLYCRTTQLREKSMMAYEQSLKLFERWCRDEMGIFTVDKVTENVIRRYISELQERGKYTFLSIVSCQQKREKGGFLRPYFRNNRLIFASINSISPSSSCSRSSRTLRESLGFAVLASKNSTGVISK